MKKVITVFLLVSLLYATVPTRPAQAQTPTGTQTPTPTVTPFQQYYWETKETNILIIKDTQCSNCNMWTAYFPFEGYPDAKAVIISWYVISPLHWGSARMLMNGEETAVYNVHTTIYSQTAYLQTGATYAQISPIILAKYPGTSLGNWGNVPTSKFSLKTGWGSGSDNPPQSVESAITRVDFLRYGTPSYKSCKNVLEDAGMEQQPLSSIWQSVYVDNRYTFGRMDTSNPLSPQSLVFGQARCDAGEQVVGTVVCDLIPDWVLTKALCYSNFDKKGFANIRQTFFWENTETLFWRFAVKGRPIESWDRQVPYKVWITSNDTGAQIVLREEGAPIDWISRTGSVNNLVRGVYTVNVWLGLNRLEGDTVIFDDFIFSPCPVDGTACTRPADIITVTPTPTNEPTQTPTGGVGKNTIENCGFEQGRIYWGWQDGASDVVFGSNNYAHANGNSPSPAIYQAFGWDGGPAYIRFKTNGAYDVLIRNMATSETYPVKVGTISTWATVSTIITLPRGTYQIVLGPKEGSGPGDFDDVTISANTWGTCSAGANTTPTPYPSATPNQTATMFPTSTRYPTSTVLAGTRTSTPYPTYTPYPTFTPPTPVIPSPTPRPPSTYTPYPTFTPQKTFTPQPTYTPNAQGTIEPSPTPAPGLPTEAPFQQPPPGYDAPCRRPDNGYAMADWIEYDRCVALSFFSMSPNAVGTMVAIPTGFANKEPGGTLGEVTDATKKIKGLVDSYDWKGPGLPGVKNAPQPGMFLTPGPWSGNGDFHFTTGTPDPSDTKCTAAITKIIGEKPAQGACFLFNILNEKGVTPWLQLAINLSAIAFLIGYIWKNWIDAGTGG